MRLAIVTTHPIQYNAPWFRLLAEHGKHQIRVFYTWEQVSGGHHYDYGFKRKVTWDIPLKEGYEFEFVANSSRNPGVHHFGGIDNPGLISVIGQFKPDAILVFGWSFKSHLACMRFFHGKIPVLFRGDSTTLDDNTALKAFLRRTFLRWVYRHVDYALYVGTNNYRYFRANGILDDRLVNVPHAVDNDRFASFDQEYHSQALSWRRKLSIDPGDFVILFAGKLEKKKNPAFLATLSESIRDTNFRFVWIGNGELEEELRARVRNDHRCIFVEFQNQSEMPIIYRMADLFVLPSTGPGETWGLALNEAMACGIPVLASDKVGGAIDLIEDNVNGKIFSLDQTEEVCAYIRSLAGDEVKWIEASNASKRKVASFSFTRIVGSLEKLLDGIELSGSRH